ncbi:uncharacterized protein LOC126789604 [Argentina anserina]|uniref:uncharacterized protein LOC126789604 n=1 Tax=Argentina anserina TaxID=57926 RepID=UPI002176772C|nr:uncharacterized protein LOC126789604 [Potentilla anserina]
MGCCLSSTATDKSSAPPNPRLHFQSRSDDSRAPPPVDEEAVKEVLSETPTPKPKLQQDQQPVLFQVPQQHNKTTTQEPVFEVKLDQIQEQQHKNKVFVDDQEPPQKRDKRIPICPEISEDASEICSLQSESVSATTATRDDDEEVQQRVVLNSRVSPRKLHKSPRDGFGPGRVVGKSPTRRTDSSPGRRYGNGVGSGRLAQPGQQAVGGRRAGLSGEPNRRDPGESSGRRSRSPATRITENGGINRANVSRSPSANRRYPGRSPVGPVESSNSSTRRRVEEPRMEEGKWAANESLENPLVSLECFIFL